MNIQQCTNCGTRVIPKVDGTCPSCRAMGVFENLPHPIANKPKPSADHADSPTTFPAQTPVDASPSVTESAFSVVKFLFGLIWAVLLIIAGILALNYSMESERQQRDREFEQQYPIEPVYPKYVDE